MDKEKMIFAELLAMPPSGRSQEETYNEIVSMVKRRYDGKISDAEAHEAARNLIGFVEVAMEIYQNPTEPEEQKVVSETEQTEDEGEKWTYKDVAYAFERAIRTLKLLPAEKIQGYKTLWPDIQYTEQEILQQTASRHLKLRPKTEDVTNLDNVLEWIALVDIEERKLIWARANRLPWKVICRQAGFERTRTWEMWRASLSKIAEHLNKEGVYKTNT